MVFVHFERPYPQEHYPDCLLVGPCSLGEGAMGKTDSKSAGAGIGSLMQMCSTDELMKGTKIPLNIFSYHYYNGISERLAPMLPDAHWDGSEAHTDEYLAVAASNAKTYAPLRDKYVPDGPMWVTESGDAGGGGDTWASTYLDVLRTLNELGSFSVMTDGVIFHNTLASSDYGFLQHGTFEPRPNYFAVLLWNTLMGTAVYDCQNPDTEGAHIYCYSRKDGKDGYVYLMINNSLSETTVVNLPGEADIYKLSGNGHVRSETMLLNGKELVISGIASLPDLSPVKKSGSIHLEPATCTFIVVNK